MREIFIFAALFLFPLTAFAQNSSIDSKTSAQEKQLLNASMENGKEITFEQIMQNPDDLQLNMQYAKTQIKHGDLKGASATLERMLMISPNNSNLRLLYAAVLYRLDDISEAKAELKKVNSKQLNTAKAQEKQILEELIARREKKYTINANLSAGIAFDTNRNAFPNSDQVSYPNGAVLKFNGKEKSDFSIIAVASADYNRKLQDSDKKTFFSGGSYYLSKQNDLSDLNMNILSAKTGVRFTGQKNVFTPQLFGSALWLNGNSYVNTLGTSLRFDHAISKETAVYADGKYQNQNYNNYAGNKKNSDRNGQTISAALGLRMLLNPRISLETEALLQNRTSKKDYFSSNSYGLSARHFWLLGKSTYLLTLLSLAKESYKDINLLEALFFGSKKREDTILRGSLMLGLPIQKNAILSLAYEYYYGHSNLSMYSYTNHKLSSTVTWKFAM